MPRIPSAVRAPTAALAVLLAVIFVRPAAAAAPAGSASVPDAAMSVSPPPPASTSAPRVLITEDMAWNRSRGPHYPAIAVAEHEQGTVVLMILVGSAGRPLAIVPLFKKGQQPIAESLVAAAVHAAARFRFHVPIRHGKPAQGWVKVPFQFKLTPILRAMTPAQSLAHTQALPN